METSNVLVFLSFEETRRSTLRYVRSVANVARNDRRTAMNTKELRESMLRPLLLLALTSATMVAAATRAQDFTGTFELTPNASDDVEAAIKTATSSMNFIVKPIARSRREANEIKRNEPITVVIGNPPYKIEQQVWAGGLKKEVMVVRHP